MQKALIIDDDSLNLRLMNAMLTHFKYDVYTCERGDQGVEMAKQIQPDLILIDLLMPKATYDGVEAVHVLRQLPQFQLTPIVAISAADSQTIKSVLSSGLFTAFMQKPITRDGMEVLLASLDQPDTA